MNSRDRVIESLNFREPDRVPFDLGGTSLSTMHIISYLNLRKRLGYSNENVEVCFIPEQLVLIDEDIAEKLETDVRLVVPGKPENFEIIFRDEGLYEGLTDEWGIGWRKPKDGGLYYDMYIHPLSDAISLDEFNKFPFPDPLDESRYKKMREQAMRAKEKDKAIVLAGPYAGITETYAFLRGYEQFYLDLAWNEEFLALLLERIVEYKSQYWTRALEEVGDLVDIIVEADDLATQDSLMMSPKTYKKIIKPFHTKLFNHIKNQASVKIFFHCCGAVRPIIGDLIEAGIDILNPVQTSSKGMNPYELKQEFGKDLVFWGGGVDTQRILNLGNVSDVKNNVKMNIEALAPGGGFVFAAVHDIQADVPPENVIAMWEACREYGVY